MDKDLEALYLMLSELANKIYPSPNIVIKEGRVWVGDICAVRLVKRIGPRHYAIYTTLNKSGQLQYDKTFKVGIVGTAFATIKDYLEYTYWGKLESILKENNLEEYLEED